MPKEPVMQHTVVGMPADPPCISLQIHHDSSFSEIICLIIVPRMSILSVGGEPALLVAVDCQLGLAIVFRFVQWRQSNDCGG